MKIYTNQRNIWQLWWWENTLWEENIWLSCIWRWWLWNERRQKEERGRQWWILKDLIIIIEVDSMNEISNVSMIWNMKYDMKRVTKWYSEEGNREETILTIWRGKANNDMICIYYYEEEYYWWEEIEETMKPTVIQWWPADYCRQCREGRSIVLLITMKRTVLWCNGSLMENDTWWGAVWLSYYDLIPEGQWLKLAMTIETSIIVETDEEWWHYDSPKLVTWRPVQTEMTCEVYRLFLWLMTVIAMTLPKCIIIMWHLLEDDRGRNIIIIMVWWQANSMIPITIREVIDDWCEKTVTSEGKYWRVILIQWEMVVCCVIVAYDVRRA